MAKKKIRVKKITMSVFCRAGDAPAVKESLEEWFSGNENFELFKDSVKVAPGKPDEDRKAQAAIKWFEELDEETSDPRQ
jgi:hypothetical protein